MTPKKSAGDNLSKRFPRQLIPAIIGIIALVFGFYTYHQGMVTSPDTATYSSWADLLISDHFNYMRFAQDASFVVPPVLYSGWTTVVALQKILFGSAWMKAVVLLNYCLALIVMWWLLKLISRITRSAVCLITSGALALLSYEMLNLIRFVLSDISFMAITFVIFYLLCGLAEKDGETKNSRAILPGQVILILLFCALALFYRPTAFPLLLLVPLAYLTRRKVLQGIEARTHLIKCASLLLFVFIAIAIIAHAYLMMNPSAWPVTFASRWIKTLSGEYQQGYVVWQRPETYYMNPASLLDFAAITLKKLAYFFSFYLSSFSLVHNLANFIFFFPVYVLSLLAIYKMFRRPGGLTCEEWWTGWLATLWIIFYALFHAFQQIDYDWRYRLTSMPQLILLSSIGLKSLLPERHRMKEVIYLRDEELKPAGGLRGDEQSARLNGE